jgi:putative hydrolase of the HAD superfamily
LENKSTSHRRAGAGGLYGAGANHTKIGMKITTVVFDFGNVLGFFSHQKAAEALARYTHLSPAQIKASYVATKLEDEYEAGRISTEDFRQQVTAACALRCTADEFDRAVGDMFTSNEEVCRLVPRLKPAYRLVLLSNTNELHAAWFRRQFADTLAHFDALVLSHEVGCRKPDAAIYRRCETAVASTPAECLFIDDLPANIEGARACGWQGLVYRPGDDIRARLAEVGVVITS